MPARKARGPRPRRKSIWDDPELLPKLEQIEREELEREALVDGCVPGGDTLPGPERATRFPRILIERDLPILQRRFTKPLKNDLIRHSWNNVPRDRRWPDSGLVWFLEVRAARAQIVARFMVARAMIVDG